MSTLVLVPNTRLSQSSSSDWYAAFLLCLQCAVGGAAAGCHSPELEAQLGPAAVQEGLQTAGAPVLPELAGGVVAVLAAARGVSPPPGRHGLPRTAEPSPGPTCRGTTPDPPPDTPPQCGPRMQPQSGAVMEVPTVGAGTGSGGHADCAPAPPEVRQALERGPRGADGKGLRKLLD